MMEMPIAPRENVLKKIDLDDPLNQRMTKKNYTYINI